MSAMRTLAFLGQKTGFSTVSIVNSSYYTADKIIGNFIRPFALKRLRDFHMKEIRTNKLRFLPTIIVAICLMAAPVLQAVTLHNQTAMMDNKSGCCCCPAEQDSENCPVKEILQTNDCPCKVEQSQTAIPAPFRADIQSKFELNQNSNICDATIANRLSEKPTWVISDNLIKTVNSPPLYISNSAFLI